MAKLARLWKEFQNNWDIYIVIIGSITVGIVAFILSTVGQTDITAVLSLTLTMLGLVAISIRRDRQIDTKTAHSLMELSGMISSLANNRVFEQQYDAYQFLISLINQSGAKEAVFLQYSCRTSLDVVRTLLNKGAKVTVFIQHEDIAARIGSQYQADRIRETTKALRSDLSGSLLEPDKLKVYKYRALGSVSAIKIDNRVLCMGWYAYKHVDPSSDKSFASDAVEILGHNIATLVIWKGTDEFKALDRTFSMLEKNYRKNSEEVPL